MLKRSRLVVVALVAVAFLIPALAAFPAGKQLKILFIPYTMEHVFQKELCDGAKIPIVGFDARIIVEDPYGKIEKELEILETYINQGIDAVIMYPIDSKALIPVVQEYKKKGIWVFTTGNHVDGEDLGMGTDERDGGLLAADMFIRYWNKEKPGIAPHILLLDIPQVPEPQRKMIAFQEVVSKKMPNATFFHVDSQGATEPSMTGTEQYLQSHPEINFIYGINASSTLGGIAACERAGRSTSLTHPPAREPPSWLS